MKDFSLSAIRPCSVVLVVGPRGCGKTTLINALLENNLKSTERIMVDGVEGDVEKRIAELETGIAGKIVVIDHVPFRQLRSAALRKVLHKEDKQGVDLIASMQSLFELSQLELRNADYLCCRALPQRELRKLSKFCGYSPNRLRKLMLEGWLIIDRRDNSLHLYQAELVPTPTPEAETTEPAPADEGWWSYLTSWFY